MHNLWIFFILCRLLSASLPDGFVYLADIEPTIIENVRYAGDGLNNFMGRPANGYKKSRIILTAAAALALKKAYALFQQYGYGLVVYDGYRPCTAVQDFIQWSQKADDQVNKSTYYPLFDKATLFRRGYLAKRSAHSRGSTVDVTLIPLGAALKPITVEQRLLCNGAIILFLNDGTADMGSHFDLFHPASGLYSQLISSEAYQKRALLRTIMKQCGFTCYLSEWWHFELKREPFPSTYFDFPIE